MLKLLLPLLIYPVPFFAQNLVIDVSRNAIQEYVSSMSTHFKDEILKAKLPPMDASRFICGVTLKDTTVTDFNFSKFSSELAGPYKDYYLNITDFSFTISGSYVRNFLFFKFYDTFSVKIKFKNVSLGALVPTFANGYPFLHGVINCGFSPETVEDPVTNGWFVTSLIREAVEENIKEAICHILVQLLDSKIRSDIHELQVDFPIFSNTSEMSFRMFKKAPYTSSTKQIRYFLEGEIEYPASEPAVFLPNEVSDEIPKRHVAYHIHEKLLAEMLEAMCEKGLFDGNFTSLPSMKPVSYLCLSASAKIQGISNTITIIIHITSLETYPDDQEKSQLRSFMVTPLHNSEHELFIRLKSQLANRWLDNTFTEQLFNHLSVVLSDNFRLPLPFIHNSSISDVIFLPNADYFTILSNFDFHQNDSQFRNR
ncbi:Lipid-binding serum glycoprotein C-terminal domain-containing protein [Caenorhabditis elegans]|uniref:Lipid-binding serum glycoprotein C-terminal domain-containing protein n=1 Tax=Caenorhabditis elegans TaxID=6239 RepID=A0A0K3AR19_CAEEL|nr:Lipid-binding serum glycoprotein C-terminal domain-containing protein [Caenorhabditis elegans]CTQ86489.1 Lipid-binding serum glycoprotein C-terminal domain-containing protein [Caenorhabditis elegans]|eukprot:NP_001300550.1 Uncharacterized protein CELE_F54H5.14 [Caenorhabditis elegans]